MQQEPSSPDGAPSSGHGQPATSAWPRRDHAALPAVGLGPKAAVLHARRMRHTEARADRPAAHTGVRLRSADAALCYGLRAAGSALFVERIQRRPLDTHLSQALVFDNVDAFRQWCDAEPLRFEDPALHQRLRRQGEAYFDARP